MLPSLISSRLTSRPGNDVAFSHAMDTVNLYMIRLMAQLKDHYAWTESGYVFVELLLVSPCDKWTQPEIKGVFEFDPRTRLAVDLNRPREEHIRRHPDDVEIPRIDMLDPMYLFRSLYWTIHASLSESESLLANSVFRDSNASCLGGTLLAPKK